MVKECVHAILYSKQMQMKRQDIQAIIIVNTFKPMKLSETLCNKRRSNKSHYPMNAYCMSRYNDGLNSLKRFVK
jgi:hypothetical protein